MQATIVPTRVLPTEENGNGLATNAIQCLLSLFLPDASYPLYYIPFYAMLKAERHGPRPRSSSVTNTGGVLPECPQLENSIVMPLAARLYEYPSWNFCRRNTKSPTFG